MQSAKILIADDDRTLRKGLRFEFEDSSYQVHEASSVKEASDLFKEIDFELIITDLKIPQVEDGLKILREAKKHDPITMVMVITGYGSIELAVQAMKAGADDFVTKDASIEEIKLKAEKLIQQYQAKLEHSKLREENIRLHCELEQKYRFENIIGNSRVFQETLKLVGKVAEDGQCTVLLQGESGTGKELIAKAIHYNSPRRDHPYVIVNIAAVPDTLLESELFGHVKGAFTDALKDRDGKFKLADGGTLFLDEIGDMPLNLQVKLLRVLQERNFEPVGSNENISVDVRIIAATNQDLNQKIKGKTFREDLYYRLNVVPIKLPSLRERKEDIPLLANHFLEKFCQERKKELKINPDIVNQFMYYDWHGNIRELENVIEQMVVLSSGNVIQFQDLPKFLQNLGQDKKGINMDYSGNFTEARSTMISNFEKQFIARALDTNAWNVSQTAKSIGVSREGLHRMIKKHGLVKLDQM